MERKLEDEMAIGVIEGAAWFRQIRSEATKAAYLAQGSDGLDPLSSLLSVSPRDFAPAVEALLDEIDLRPPTSVPSYDSYGVLLQGLRDRPGSTPSALVEELAAPPGVQEVHGNRGLPNALPEASGLRMSGTGEVDAHEFLDPPREALWVGGDSLPWSGELPDSTPDIELGSTNGSEVGDMGETLTVTHTKSIEEVREELNQKRGKWTNRYWIMVEDQGALGVLVETNWMPSDCNVQEILGGAFVRGDDGHFRAHLLRENANGFALGKIFQKFALLTCMERDSEDNS